jgi:hypothetical protein
MVSQMCTFGLQNSQIWRVVRFTFALSAFVFLVERSVGQSVPDPSQQALAAALSRLIENAIPLEYDKQKDWGATTDIPVGLRTEGSGLKLRIKKRERAVNHGVWKHYTLRLVDPQQNLHVQLVELRPLTIGRVAFRLQLDAKIDAWARAKVYQYGVHLIALEMEADMRVRATIDGEVGIEPRQHADGGGHALAVVPVVTAAQLQIDEFHLRRVSNADGPIVRELGDGVRKLVEDELNGPKLVEKLNRAIEKKRDRLEFRPAELLEQKWWPIADRIRSVFPQVPAPAQP